jgi:hypothetical protein
VDLSIKHFEFSPSLHCLAMPSPLYYNSSSIRLPATTMTSADFSTYRNTEPNSRPPSACPELDSGVRLLSFALCSLHLLKTNNNLSDFVLMWILILDFEPLIQFLFVDTELCSLAYFSASLTRSHLATCYASDTTPRVRDLHPMDKFRKKKSAFETKFLPKFIS